ncbi:MAG TPA: hypothetical protein PK095_25180, partial [Myxococcota bacterium]|nr:hypothetical protein [Myxococcota bacterium]
MGRWLWVVAVVAACGGDEGLPDGVSPDADTAPPDVGDDAEVEVEVEDGASDDSDAADLDDAAEVREVEDAGEVTDTAGPDGLDTAADTSSDTGPDAGSP